MPWHAISYVTGPLTLIALFALVWLSNKKKGLKQERERYALSTTEERMAIITRMASRTGLNIDSIPERDRKALAIKDIEEVSKEKEDYFRTLRFLSIIGSVLLLGITIVSSIAPSQYHEPRPRETRGNHNPDDLQRLAERAIGAAETADWALLSEVTTKIGTRWKDRPDVAADLGYAHLVHFQALESKWMETNDSMRLEEARSAATSAAACLRRSVEAEPGDRRNILLAHALYGKGDADSIIEAHGIIVGLQGSSRDLLEENTRNTYNHLRWIITIARARIASADQETYLSSAEKLVRDRINDPKSPIEDRAWAYYDLACIYCINGRFDAAMAAIGDATKLLIDGKMATSAPMLISRLKSDSDLDGLRNDRAAEVDKAVNRLEQAFAK